MIEDWYQIQKEYQGWNEILPDYKIIELVAKQSWSLNLKHCHKNLRDKLKPYHVEKSEIDFSVITDIELSKLPLKFIFKMIKNEYQTAKVGVYVALLSYYLNTPPYNNLPSVPYSENIATVFKQNLSFANQIENKSCVIDNPITKSNCNILIEGSNFIFVHPNIRYFLWK